MSKRMIRHFCLSVLLITSALFFSACQDENEPFQLSTGSANGDSRYDLVVVGSEPEGIAAAISGAKNGLDTVIIDFERDKVGGLYTLGWLNMIDLNYTGGGSSEILQQGIFSEVYTAIGSKSAFDTEEMEEVFMRLLNQYGVKVVTDLKADWQVRTVEGRVTGIEVMDGEEAVTVEAGTYIDATQNADIARGAGVAFFDGQEEFGLKGLRGADTLVFKVDNVNWDQVTSYLAKDGDDGTGSTEHAAWGYLELRSVAIEDENFGVRAPNIGLQNDGSLLLNSLLIYHMDLEDREAHEEIRERAKEIIENDIMPFMRENYPGWEDAVFVDIAPEFYIRESYHMDALKRLTAGDVFESRNPEDAVAEGSYPIDLQARNKNLSGISLSATTPYGIPFGAMVPKSLDNLLVVGKAGGYDPPAFGSARTVPVGMALGESAGAAAAIAKKESVASYREMANDSDLIKSLKSLLKSQGVVFHDIKQTKGQLAFINYWAYDDIRALRDKGLIGIGYTDHYALDEDLTRATVNRTQYALQSNSPFQTTSIPVESLPEGAVLTPADLEIVIASFLREEPSSLQEYLNRSILRADIYDHIAEKATLTNGEYYAALHCLVLYMEAQGTKYHRDVL